MKTKRERKREDEHQRWGWGQSLYSPVNADRLGGMVK